MSDGSTNRRRTTAPAKGPEEVAAEIEALEKRYLELCHAMQSGVAMSDNETPHGGRDMTPKHLRVGINAAMADHGALVYLLVDKGFITDLEYRTALVASMKREVGAYEQRLEERLGRRITLG